MAKVIIFRRKACNGVRRGVPNEKNCKKVKKILTLMQHFGTLDRLY